MAPPTARELVHQVNNLLCVIAVQAAVGKASDGKAMAALELIEKAGQETAEVVRQFAAELRQAEA